MGSEEDVDGESFVGGEGVFEVLLDAGVGGGLAFDGDVGRVVWVGACGWTCLDMLSLSCTSGSLTHHHISTGSPG